MKNAVIYTRVSSTGDRQSTERQIQDLSAFAGWNDLQLLQTFEEHISGAKKNEERPQLVRCLAFCREQHPDMLLVTELSEAARIKRQNIKEHLNSGRARYKAVGGKLGRPQGTGLSPAGLLAKYPGVSRRLRRGQTIGDIAQLESVSESTVKKVKKALLGPSSKTVHTVHIDQT